MTVGLGGAGLPAKSEGTSKAQSTGTAAASAVAKGIAAGAEKAAQATQQTQPSDQSNIDKKLKNESIKPIDIFGDRPHPILCTMPPEDPFIKKLNAHIDPAKLVENVRQNDGTEGKIAMHEFDAAVDKMGTKNLKEVRDYLVNEMASPKNKDDQLLGSMLDSVNKKLDSKDSFSIHKDPFGGAIGIDPGFNPGKHFPIDPGFNDKGIEGNHGKHFPIDPGFNDKGIEGNHGKLFPIDPGFNPSKKHIEYPSQMNEKIDILDKIKSSLSNKNLAVETNTASTRPNVQIEYPLNEK